MRRLSSLAIAAVFLLAPPAISASLAQDTTNLGTHEQPHAKVKHHHYYPKKHHKPPVGARTGTGAGLGESSGSPSGN